MQTSGDQRRESADTHSPVIVREGGRSSIPETSMIESISCSVLDAPPSRGMTVVVVLRYFTVIACDKPEAFAQGSAKRRSMHFSLVLRNGLLRLQ
jgi:hypothetical protein